MSKQQHKTYFKVFFFCPPFPGIRTLFLLILDGFSLCTIIGHRNNSIDLIFRLSARTVWSPVLIGRYVAITGVVARYLVCGQMLSCSSLFVSDVSKRSRLVTHLFPRKTYIVGGSGPVHVDADSISRGPKKMSKRSDKTTKRPWYILKGPQSFAEEVRENCPRGPKSLPKRPEKIWPKISRYPF